MNKNVTGLFRFFFRERVGEDEYLISYQQAHKECMFCHAWQLVPVWNIFKRIF